MEQAGCKLGIDLKEVGLVVFIEIAIKIQVVTVIDDLSFGWPAANLPNTFKNDADGEDNKLLFNYLIID